MAGTLFVVATPIGNLEDLTFRALRVLKAVDVIAAEDTRRTAKLLAHYEIRKPLLSVREHNEHRETPHLIARLTRGESIALVTDAGTPGIADPGARLVRAVREASLPVVPVPGASAVTAALSVSGVGGDEFVFMGFPPRSGTARTDWLDRLAMESRPVVIFEAPHRIRRTLGDITKHAISRNVIVFREITKHHEHAYGHDELRSVPDVGEFVVVVSGLAEEFQGKPDSSLVVDLFGRLTNLAGVSETMASDLVGHAFKIQPSAVRNVVRKHRILVKNQIKGAP